MNPVINPSRWQFWIDRGGTFTDVVGRAPDGVAAHAQAAVGEPRAVPRRRGRGHPAAARPGGGRADHAGPGRVREDGHHGGHQRAAGAQGRPHAARHQPRLRRRAAHRLPGPAQAVRAPHRAARTALRTRARGRGAHRCAWRGLAAAERDAPAPRAAGGVRRRHPRLRHRLHAWLPLHRARGRGRAAGAPDRLHAGQRLARGQPADEAGGARRHHGGRRLPEPDPAPLCRPGGRPDARRAPVLHAEQRRPDRGAPLPGQGRDPVGPGRRHRRHGAHRGRGRPRPGDRLRHGRHQHRRLALRRRIRTRVRDPGRRRAHARADDEHPHRGRRRRLAAAVRRRTAARRPAERGRQPRPGQLPPRRAADDHRRQCVARQDRPRPLPESLRPQGRPGARSRRGRWRSSSSWPRACAPPAAATSRPSRWRRASCRSRCRTWPTRSSASRSRAVTT